MKVTELFERDSGMLPSYAQLRQELISKFATINEPWDLIGRQVAQMIHTYPKYAHLDPKSRNSLIRDVEDAFKN